MQRKADRSLSKPIVIKKYKDKEDVIKKVDDDAGLNYLIEAQSKQQP